MIHKPRRLFPRRADEESSEDEAILIDLTTWEVGDEPRVAADDDSPPDHADAPVGRADAGSLPTAPKPSSPEPAADAAAPVDADAPRLGQPDLTAVDLVDAWKRRQSEAGRLLGHHTELDGVPQADDVSEVEYKWTLEDLFEESRAVEHDWLDRIANDDRIDWDSDNPLRVLGLPDNVAWSTVVATHRALAKRFHPDTHPDADAAERELHADRMGRVNQAFATLRAQRGR